MFCLRNDKFMICPWYNFSFLSIQTVKILITSLENILVLNMDHLVVELKIYIDRYLNKIVMNKFSLNLIDLGHI